MIWLQVTGAGLILLGFWVLLDTSKSHILHLLLAEDTARLVILLLSYLLLLLGCSMVGLVFLGCYALQTRPTLILVVSSDKLDVKLLITEQKFILSYPLSSHGYYKLYNPPPSIT